MKQKHLIRTTKEDGKVTKVRTIKETKKPKRKYRRRTGTRRVTKLSKKNKIRLEIEDEIRDVLVGQIAEDLTVLTLPMIHRAAVELRSVRRLMDMTTDLSK